MTRSGADSMTAGSMGEWHLTPSSQRPDFELGERTARPNGLRGNVEQIGSSCMPSFNNANSKIDCGDQVTRWTETK